MLQAKRKFAPETRPAEGNQAEAIRDRLSNPPELGTEMRDEAQPLNADPRKASESVQTETGDVDMDRAIWNGINEASPSSSPGRKLHRLYLGSIIRTTFSGLEQILIIDTCPRAGIQYTLLIIYCKAEL